MFTSFCLETNEYLNFSGKFIVQDISTEARNGGSGGGNPDPLSQYSAYLYHNFSWGTLEQYAYTGATARFANRAASANALQEAIWWFENETLGKTNYYTELALNAVNSGNWWGLGDVCVINLVDANGNRAQDQITVVPLEELATITVTVIFNFSLNRVIGIVTGKKCADNRLVPYMTIAVSFFHMPPPFLKPPSGVSRPIVYLTRVTLSTVEGVVVYDLSFKANGFEITSSTADLFMENSVSPLQARQALFATLSKLSA